MLPRSNAFWRVACALALACAFYLAEGARPSFAGNLLYTGVNLSGAEFGAQNLPGAYNGVGPGPYDYIYPNSQEVDYYMKKGMNTFRLPFRWERMQRTPNGALDATELSRMDTFVNYATSKGNYVLIDPHNFQRYYPLSSNFQQSTQGLVGGDGTANPPSQYKDAQSSYNSLNGGSAGDVVITNAMFADFWGKMAAHYAGNSRVIFDLNNEPANVLATQVVSADNAAIAAIRSAGANNLIMLEGSNYTGAWTWTNNSANNGNNSTAFLPANIVDPANNWAIEVHQYFDSDGSGGHSTINNSDPTTGVQRLTAFTNWARQNGVKAFLGEFAVSNSITTASKTDTTTLGNATIVNTLNYMNANSDVWTGWNWWGGGPWWGNYMFGLDPTNLSNPTDKNVMYPLSRFLPQAGDINNDGHVNSTDIALMQAALSDLNGWYASMTSFGLTQTQENLIIDVNKDGVVNNADLQKLLGIIKAGGGSESVPEPASVVLLGLAVLMLPTMKRVRR